MATRKNPIWIELVQLLPIISFAFPFIVEGRVELARAGTGFLIGALLTLPVVVVVAALKHVFNPILVGVGLWLWLGALAFQLDLEGVKGVLVSSQASGMFVAAFAVGAIATFSSPHGYVGCRTDDPVWLRRTSLGLLALTALATAFSFLMRHDIRLGGGVPFIVLNVARRVLIARAAAGAERP